MATSPPGPALVNSDGDSSSHPQRDDVHELTVDSNDISRSACSAPGEDGIDLFEALEGDVKTFRRLYSDRSARWEDNGQLIELAYELCVWVWHAERLLKDDAETLLNRIFAGTGLMDLYLDVMKSDEDDFLAAPLDFTKLIIEPLIRIVIAQQSLFSEKCSLDLALHGGLARVWKRVWEQRRLLKVLDADDHQYPEGHPCREDVMSCQPLLKLLEESAILHKTILETVNFKALDGNFLPYVALWYWGLEISDEQPGPITYHLLGLFGATTTGMKDSDYPNLVKEAILAPGALGVEKFFVTLGAALARGVRMQQDDTDKPTLNSLCEVLRLLDAPTIRPHLRKHGIHEAVVRFTANMVRINSSNTSPQYQEAVWGLAVTITRHLLEDESRLGSTLVVEGVRGEDVITLISAMLDWIIIMNVRDGTRRENATCRLIKLLEPTISAIQAKRKRNTLAKEFIAGLKNQARIDWWPSLRAMQGVRYWISTDDPYQIIVHDAAVREWTQLGETLGLNVEVEQKRYEQDAARRCSWFACSSHRATSDETVKLLSCKGCGDARYCARVCQISDWKEGRHKQKCRRLKC